MWRLWKVRVVVDQNERVIVERDMHPIAYLGPGVHKLRVTRGDVVVRRFDTRRLCTDLNAAQAALVPTEDLAVVEVGPSERALVYRLGKPVMWLEPGRYQVWTTERVRSVSPDGSEVWNSAVRVELLDVSQVDVSPLSTQVREIVPSVEYIEVTVANGTVALQYVDGELVRVLGPGRYASWRAVRKVEYVVVDLRERVVQIGGQEVMTKDRVTVRLNLAATYRVADAQRLASIARAPDDVLYLAVQLAAREAVGGLSLDELLAAREALSKQLEADVSGRAEALGLTLVELGLKDLILPGEMKALLNRVIEARKQAEANVILRREETAATRSMAQTAKLLAESPLLVRLKELEAYKELASSVGELTLVVSPDGLPALRRSV